jgi:hypothetical protein
MLRFNKLQESGSKVIQVNEKITSDFVIVDFTSSYSSTKLTPQQIWFPPSSSIESNKTTSQGGWLQFAVSSSVVPDESGQYMTNIFEGNFTEREARWNQINVPWNSIPITWASFRDLIRNERVKLLSEEMAYIEGTNEVPQITYTGSGVAAPAYKTYQN